MCVSLWTSHCAGNEVVWKIVTTKFRFLIFGEDERRNDPRHCWWCFLGSTTTLVKDEEDVAHRLPLPNRKQARATDIHRYPKPFYGMEGRTQPKLRRRDSRNGIHNAAGRKLDLFVLSSYTTIPTSFLHPSTLIITRTSSSSFSFSSHYSLCTYLIYHGKDRKLDCIIPRWLFFPL